MLDAVSFQHQQQAINIGCATHIHGLFGQFIHGSEIACQPVAVGEIKTITPKYLDVYFCAFFLSHPKQYHRETLAQNMREFLSRYLAWRKV